MMTDPIADMLTRLRNATMRRSLTTRVPASRVKEAIAKILADNGWIESYEVVKLPDEPAYVLLTLKYHGQRSVIRGVQRISKSGQRIYMNRTELGRRFPSKLETVVISTPQGLLTGAAAKSANLGGEVLFKIW